MGLALNRALWEGESFLRDSGEDGMMLYRLPEAQSRGLTSLFPTPQGLRILEPECEPLHGQHAVALLPAVVHGGPICHLRQLPHPVPGVFPPLDHGELGTVGGQRASRGSRLHPWDSLVRSQVVGSGRGYRFEA